MTNSKKRVAIAGGGVAGLTVAHELSRTGHFDVTVYESKPILGGKARSLRLPSGNPTEHAFRVYLAAYRSLYQTMEEIPYKGSSAYDNLVYADFALKYGNDQFVLSSAYTTFWRFAADAFNIFRFFHHHGIAWGELLLFMYRIVRLLWMSDARIRAELDTISFETYMEAEKRSEAFKNLVFTLPEVLVAGKRTASATVISRILLEWFVTPWLRSPYKRRGFAALNGPTSEHFLDPWRDRLRAAGVEFRHDARLTAIRVADGQISGFELADGVTATADDYVVALPQTVLAALLTPELKKMLPSLRNLMSMGIEWSNGVQFYLADIPDWLRPQVGRITLCIDAPWSIVFAIESNEAIWSNVPFPEGVKAVLTAVMSNVSKPGPLYGRPYSQCTKEEILKECLTQIGLANAESLVREGTVDPDLIYLTEEEWAQSSHLYAGYAVSHLPAGRGVVVTQSMLYIRNPGDRMSEPPNQSEIANLFVTGEFTSTQFGLPTMEKSNESGKRCAYAICKKWGVAYEPDRFSSSELPLAFLRR
jgi:uncharacterized protein with NAD-binding domain and iron-sulfur cluster